MEALTPESIPCDVIRAAAELLLDPNPRVHAVCEDRLLVWGAASRPALEAVAECDDPRAARRVRRVLQTLHVRLWAQDFQAFALRGDIDLETGLLFVCKLLRPLLRVERITEILDDWADRLRSRIAGTTAADETAVAADYFSGELGLRGDERTYYDADNSCLDQVLRRRRGIPLTLSAVYLLVGRRARLLVEGVSLPGHFLVRMRSRRTGRDRLLDPFHAARALTLDDCARRLRAMGYGFRDSHMRGVSDSHMLLRALGNLGQAIGQGEDQELISAVQRARLALALRLRSCAPPKQQPPKQQPPKQQPPKQQPGGREPAR